MSNVSVVASLANGKNVIGTTMWLTEIGEVSGENGSVDFTFESGSVIEA